jgi:hypothetical protein
MRAGKRTERLLRDYYADAVTHEAGRIGIEPDEMSIQAEKRDGPLMPILAAAAACIFVMGSAFFSLPRGSLGDVVSQVEGKYRFSRSVEETLAAIGTYFRNEQSTGGDV